LAIRLSLTYYCHSPKSLQIVIPVLIDISSSERFRPMEATPVDRTPAPAETAGSIGHMDYNPQENLLASHPPPSQDATSDERTEQNGEQALESHEVIELQAFSERKEWIAEKIKVRAPVLFLRCYFS